MGYLLQSPSNTKRNIETNVPWQWLVPITMQNIMKRQISDVIIHEEMLPMFYTVANECYNIWMPQSGSSPNHIQELFFFLEWQWYHIDVFHNKYLEKIKKLGGDGGGQWLLITLVNFISNKKSACSSIYLAILEFGSVNRTKRPLSKKILFTEVVCCQLKFCQSVNVCTYWGFIYRETFSCWIFFISVVANTRDMRWEKKRRRSGRQ